MKGDGIAGKTAGIVAACAGTILLVLATVVACIEGVAFDRGFYRREYARLDTASYVGVDDATLWEATEALLGYLEGGRDDIDLTAQIGGNEAEYYTQREKQHMVDVAALNQNAVAFMVFGFIAGGVLVLISCLLVKKAYLVLKGAFFSMVGVLCAFGVLAAWAAADFNSFWTNFHYVFFTNDLWMLDPASSLMIRMFEQSFFFDMVTLILVIFISIMAASLLLTGTMYRKLRKKA